MGFDTIIRNGIAIINRTTVSLQVPVVHKAWIGQTGFGETVFSQPVTRLAIVDQSAKPHFTPGGQMILTKATITFLAPIPPQTEDGTAPDGTPSDRVEPIDSRDVFILPDGTTGPVVDVSGGLIDAGTNAPYFSKVTLGK
jgi:hypothetical protein